VEEGEKITLGDLLFLRNREDLEVVEGLVVSVVEEVLEVVEQVEVGNKNRKGTRILEFPFYIKNHNFSKCF